MDQMAEYKVITTGMELFDSAHALGFGCTLAELAGGTVGLMRSGLCYDFSVLKLGPRAPARTRPDQILELPSGADLDHKPGLAHANLDGLLTACFTAPGVRAVSLQDAREQSAGRPDVMPRAIAKAKSLVERLGRYAYRCSGATEHWCLPLFREYEEGISKIPLPSPRTSNSISITMPLEPALGYAARRTRDDGFISNAYNVGIEQARYAGVLAYIGAARFLRGQRVGATAVLLVLPVFDSLIIQPGDALQGLMSSVHGWRSALLIQWLALWKAYGHGLAGVSYQVLQTQAAKQSISIKRGYLSYSYLAPFSDDISQQLCTRWSRLLGGIPDGSNRS